MISEKHISKNVMLLTDELFNISVSLRGKTALT